MRSLAAITLGAAMSGLVGGASSAAPAETEAVHPISAEQQVLSDVRSIMTWLEAYRIVHRKYPVGKLVRRWDKSTLSSTVHRYSRFGDGHRYCVSMRYHGVFGYFDIRNDWRPRFGECC